jgi:hypothetical protein
MRPFIDKRKTTDDQIPHAVLFQNVKQVLEIPELSTSETIEPD